MKNTTENLDQGDDEILLGDDTMELPPLDITGTPLDPEVVVGETVRPQSQALLWLKHMESELDGLQARWGQLDAELNERDAALAAQDRLLAAGKVELQAVQDQGRELGQRLAAALAEIERLSAAARQERTEREDLARHLDVRGEENQSLRVKIQDLELYIDGRQKDWSALNAELAKYRTDLDERDRRVEERIKEEARLNDRVLELEKHCADLVDRRQEREDAHRALEERLRQEIESAAQLKAAHAQSERAAKDALDVAESAKQLLDSLQEDVERRDARISELTARNEALAAMAGEAEKKALELAAARSALATLSTERDELKSSLALTSMKLTELEQRAGTAADEARAAEARLQTQSAHVRRLEAELGDGHETLHLLDKNLRRINVLAASLQRADQAGAADAAGGPRSNVHYLGGADHGVRPRTKMLVGVDNPATVRFPLSKQNMTIGRARESDICISGQFVSRIHARVLCYAAGTIIEDLGSKNGIFVNARPISRCALKDGDIVSLGGKLDLRYVELDA